VRERAISRGRKIGQFQEGDDGDMKKKNEGLPNSIPIWYIQLALVVLATTTGFTSSRI